MQSVQAYDAFIQKCHDLHSDELVQISPDPLRSVYGVLTDVRGSDCGHFREMGLSSFHRPKVAESCKETILRRKIVYLCEPGGAGVHDCSLPTAKQSNAGTSFHTTSGLWRQPQPGFHSGSAP